MRHAPEAAARATSTVPVMLVGTLAPMLGALTLAVALLGACASGARALDSTGGTAAPSSASTADVAGLGGSVAPATKGTGGSEYGVLLPKPSAPPKAAVHKTSHAAGRNRAKPKAPAPKPRPKPKPAPKPVPPSSTSSPPGVPSPAQTVAEGAVFPVVGSHSFGGPENRFGAAREGHIHEGQDVLAGEGLQVVAPLGGTIVTTAYQAGGAGWYAAEQTVDGLASSMPIAKRPLLPSAPARPSKRVRRSARLDRPATPPGRTCTWRSGSVAGRPRAATRSIRCRISRRGKLRQADGRPR